MAGYPKRIKKTFSRHSFTGLPLKSPKNHSCYGIFHGFSMVFPYFPWIFHGFSMDFPCSTGLKPTWMVSVLCFTNSAMVRSVRAEATEPAMVDTTCRSRSEAKRSEWFGIGAKCHEMPGKWCPIVR